MNKPLWLVLVAGAAPLTACGKGAELRIFPSPVDAGLSSPDTGAVGGTGGQPISVVDAARGNPITDSGCEAGNCLDVGAQCGNGVLENGEQCDDGNLVGGDGCSARCLLEAGWTCPNPNQPCVAAQCGDGILAGNEACDDGNTVAGDGCSPTCTIEPNAVCPPTGGACIAMVCGDGKVTGSEQCDDGVNDGQHGCSPSCQLLAGWTCPLPGTPCIAICGDRRVVGNEQCDEGGDVPCCTADCRLKPGFVCDPNKTPHSQPAAPYCGDGVVQGPTNPASAVLGAEQCDDGNHVPFDGCSPDCHNEPLCGTINTALANPTPGNYQCFAVCGDGLVMPPEECDDGNTADGDGCDHDCKIEKIPGTMQPAWTCTQAAPGTSVVLPVIWRDFSTRSHPQFSIEPLVNRRLPGIAQRTLQQVALPAGLRNKFKYVPAYDTAFVAPAFGTPFGGSTFAGTVNWTMNGPGWVAGSEGFRQPPWMAGNSLSFAVDLVWWANQTPTLASGNANPLLTPAGRYGQWYVDDPTVNIPFPGAITLAQLATGAFQYSCDDNGCDSAFTGNPTGFFPLDNLGWVAAGSETARDGGHNYSFTTETRYWFMYRGAERLDFFGDDDLWVFVNGQLALDVGGIHQKLAGFFQLANDGTATVCVENTPGQGAVNNCVMNVNFGLTPGVVYEVAIFHAEREVVASNFQLTLQGFNSTPSVCVPICGDGFVAGNEQCDRGAANVPPGGNIYGQCTTDCRLGPYCGDAVTQSPPEACDNGLNITTYTPAPPAASVCAPGCVTPPYCGDGQLERVFGEECDDGTGNENTYGRCQTNCTLGPRCGDGVIQAAAGEACDNGSANAPNAYGSGLCLDTCQPAPFCGDGIVELDFGEQCDSTPNCDANCRFIVLH